MKATDQDLEKMFKLNQEHSVAAACRAIYDAGVEHGMGLLAEGSMTNGPAGTQQKSVVTWSDDHPVKAHVDDLLTAAASAS